MTDIRVNSAGVALFVVVLQEYTVAVVLLSA
jgi:hypothetical protein